MARKFTAIVVFLVLAAGWLPAAPPADAVCWMDEDFSGGLPSGWSIQNAGGIEGYWRTDIPYDFPGVTAPYACIDPWYNGAYEEAFSDGIATGAFDTRNAEQVLLRFDYYLWQDTSDPDDTFRVHVSSDAGWVAVHEFTDAGGMEQQGTLEVDITAAAAGKDNVRIHWVFTDPGDPAWGFWCVDNVEVWVLEKPVLTLDLAVNMTEGAAFTATLTRNRGLAAALTVALAAGDPGLVTMPATAVFGAGDADTTVSIAIPDNTDPARFLATALTLTAPGYPAVTLPVRVYNEDTDGDTLGDDWEVHYFGSLAPLAADDPDGDGRTNAGEYGGGTDPIVADAPSGTSGTASGCLPGGGTGAFGALALICLAAAGRRRGNR